MFFFDNFFNLIKNDTGEVITGYQATRRLY
jgi:hypothetical protein